MGSRQPDDTPGGVLVLDVAPATPSSSALPDDAPDLPDNVTLFTGHYTGRSDALVDIKRTPLYSVGSTVFLPTFPGYKSGKFANSGQPRFRIIASKAD